MMAQTMSGFTGDQLLDGRYRLIEPIGTGGMSTVWRARDERLGRVVAVKTLGRRLLADRTAQRRLAAEARTLARLSHPHIAVVHDYGVARVAGGVVPYLVMEVVDGTPLATVLAERDLGWPAAVGVCAQVASAVAAAHARGVVHRDISANNVLLADTGVTVIDFGISGFVDQPADTETFGTPAYTAPERLDGAPVHPAADVYALGVLLYRCLTGRLPWPPTSLVGLLSAHRNRDPRPLPDIAGLPPQVADMCLACLEKDPAARPDAETVAEVLAAAL
ncbi:MAG: serine/threonine protein kinase, partial [Mycobacteriaceae bacterium]|nr:serine/threonine protein kinase [Mycobacteriaceae bacterium]